MRRYSSKLKLDSNHVQIVNELRQRGVEVVEIMEPVDIVAKLRSMPAGFIELKPNGRGTYTRKQLTFISETRMPIAIARTVGEALKFLETGEGLTFAQKDNLAVFLLRTEGNKWNSEKIEAVLGMR